MSAFGNEFISFVQEVLVHADVLGDNEFLSSTEAAFLLYGIICWSMADNSPLYVVIPSLIFDVPDFLGYFALAIVTVLE